MVDVVEPVATPRGPGRIILLNGASSSGKSTLSAALRDGLDEPFLHVSSDRFVAAGMLPPRRDDGGPFDHGHLDAHHGQPRPSSDQPGMRCWDQPHYGYAGRPFGA